MKLKHAFLPIEMNWTVLEQTPIQIIPIGFLKYPHMTISYLP